MPRKKSGVMEYLGFNHDEQYSPIICLYIPLYLLSVSPLLLICVAFELPISLPFAQHEARRPIAADYHYGFGVSRKCVFMLFNENAQSCIVLKWKSKREGIDKLCSSEDRLAN